MKVEFTNRAVGDLRKISDQSHKEFGASVAAALELRIRRVVEQVGQAPESAPRVEQRPGMRVLPLVRYPFKIFYRIIGDGTVRILHIRHTARRPWTEEGE
jgi:plasmid stabilization system protein ParE